MSIPSKEALLGVLAELVEIGLVYRKIVTNVIEKGDLVAGRAKLLGFISGMYDNDKSSEKDRKQAERFYIRLGFTPEDAREWIAEIHQSDVPVRLIRRLPLYTVYQRADNTYYAKLSETTHVKIKRLEGSYQQDGLIEKLNPEEVVLVLDVARLS